MQTLQELGEAVAARRKQLGLKQGDVAAMAGVSAESLSRFERGRSVLGAELSVMTHGQTGNLDELRRERSQTAPPEAGAT